MSIIDLVGYTVFYFRKKRPLPKEIKKILISKIDHLGDVLMSTAVIPAIKKRFPDAEIHMLVGSWAEELLDKNPYIHKLIFFDSLMLNREKSVFKKIKNSITIFFKASRTIRNEKYNVGIDLRAYPPNSALLLCFGKVNFKIGYGTAGLGFLFDRCLKWIEGLHEIDHFFDLLKEIGIHCSKSHIPEFYNFGTQQDIENILNTYNCSLKMNFIVIHPGSGSPQRMIETKTWISLINQHGNLFENIIIAGIKSEGKIADEIVNGVFSKINILNFAGKLSLSEFAILVKHAKLFIGLESFGVHLAASVGTPTVAIFSGITDTEQWKPVSTNTVRVIKKNIDCAPCFRSNACKDMECMKFDVQEVSSKIKAILSGRQTNV